jgi:hypothetical protein
VICFLVPSAEDYRIRHYLDMCGPSVAERFRILHWESLGAQTVFEPCTYVLAGLDRLSPGMERLAGELDRRLSESSGVRILNHASLTLRRFDLLTELRRRGLNDFGVVRANGDLAGMRYPVFLREDCSHDGAISPLLESPREVEAAIGRAVLQGYRMRNLVVIEFLQTADSEGFYRKYSAFIVGPRIVARSLNYGRNWMLKHGGNEYSRAMLIEERDYVFDNPHTTELAEIFRAAHCDYGRIDYAIKNGRIQTWEINLNPAIGRRTGPTRLKLDAEGRAIRDETKARFYAGFQEAWEAVDRAPGGGALVIALDALLVRAAQAGEARRGRLLAAFRALLRPAKRLLEPRAKPVLRLVGRLARRAEG